MNKEEAIKKAHAMYAYELSEQTDQKTHDFDDLWQSLNDVCQLISLGIFEDIEEDEIQEVLSWVKETQPLTKLYQDKELNF